VHPASTQQPASTLAVSVHLAMLDQFPADIWFRGYRL
jgi:hypothetical protein